MRPRSRRNCLTMRHLSDFLGKKSHGKTCLAGIEISLGAEVAPVHALLAMHEGMRRRASAQPSQSISLLHAHPTICGSGVTSLNWSVELIKQ